MAHSTCASGQCRPKNPITQCIKIISLEISGLLIYLLGRVYLLKISLAREWFAFITISKLITK